MAYLDNTAITVDAVLTKKGRERLGQGRDAFNITKFAVSDDEVDYTLYNTAHPLGTNYFSTIIESMPVLEAIPDESQTMRYKLTSLSVGLKRVPQIKGAGMTDQSIEAGTDTWVIEPKTVMFGTAGAVDAAASFDTLQGYTLILFDEEAATVNITRPLDARANYIVPGTNVSPVANFSSTVVKAGHAFEVVPKEVTVDRNTKVTIFGNESGVTKTLSLTVTKPPTGS
tara:strand:- start:489 stop:1169 length:681 start_codon:yes stop_codon:yes gene_type:complete